MAVRDFLRPQRSPLSVYDEQMAEMLRQQSAGIGARDIAAESALGFPVGTMTSKILGNVLAGAKAKSAINRDAEADRARSLYAQYLKTGKIDGKSVDESGNIYEMTEQPMFNEEQVQSMVPSGTNEIGVPSLGRAPEVSVAQNEVRDMTALMPSPSSVGEKSDPSWFDRTFGGEIKTDKYSSLDEIKRAGNIDAIQSLVYEEEREKAGQPQYEIKTDNKGNIFYYDAKNPEGGQWIQSPYVQEEGFEILSPDQIEINNLPSLENGFYQRDKSNGRIYSTSTKTGTKVEVQNYLGEDKGAEAGAKGRIERYNKRQDALFGVGGSQQVNREALATGNTLLRLLEGEGNLSGAWAPFKRFLLRQQEALGILSPKEEERLAAMEGFTAESNQIVLKFIKNLGRNPTDLDLKFMIETMPNIGKSELANQYIIKSRMVGAKYVNELLEWEKNYIINRNDELINSNSSKRVDTHMDEINALDKARIAKRKEIQEKMTEELKAIRELVDIEEENERKGNIITDDELINVNNQSNTQTEYMNNELTLRNLRKILYQSNNMQEKAELEKQIDELMIRNQEILGSMQ